MTSTVNLGQKSKGSGTTDVSLMISDCSNWKVLNKIEHNMYDTYYDTERGLPDTLIGECHTVN